MAIDLLEQTLEDIIYNNRSIIHTKGLSRLRMNTFRQVVLPSSRKIDILSFEINEGCFNCDIYELKRDVINADAVCQAFNYFKEIRYLTKSWFCRLDAKIIMVGKKYEPISILDSLPVPVSVYIYKFAIDSIKIKEVDNPHIDYLPNDSFSFGLWAFGHHGLGFSREQKTVSFHSVFEQYASDNSGYKAKIKKTIDLWIKEIEVPESVEENEVIDYPTFKPKVYTEIFPEPLGWTKEFAAQIPYNNIMEDMEIDTCDDEIEEDADYSDFEPDFDMENEQDEVWLAKEIDTGESPEIENNAEN